MSRSVLRRSLVLATVLAVPAPVAVALPALADSAGSTGPSQVHQGGVVLSDARVSGHHRTGLRPRTHFVMAADGSSGRRPDGAGIPNIDSVKSTIRAYYNATGGIADKKNSPYIRELEKMLRHQARQLPALYAQAERSGKRPAIVLDADDTMLWTYDMEDKAMNFTFDPALQDVWVQGRRFPATPGMTAFVAQARKAGFAIFGLTGRSDDQKTATLANLAKVGYRGFTPANFYTKWTGKDGSNRPAYLNCATAKCSTVEYKAGTRKHIESLGYDIALSVGDQWSDLQGGHADHTLKLPNPTYYLPSTNLPGVVEPRLAPRTHFVMKPDGSSGRYVGGEAIPNIDSVKSTIRTYYRATDGIADKTSSPYITEMNRLTRRLAPGLGAACTIAKRHGLRPAVVLDADDTSLWTYDMEDAAMRFTFEPALQDVWVQQQKFPAIPGMVALERKLHRSGCTIIGLTGRDSGQKGATLANLDKVGYRGFTAKNYYTKWTSKGEDTQPGYITCATAKCTTVEYKSQTRKFVQSRAGGNYTILANVGDQFSDLIGGHALLPVKLPNPTYYLP